MFRPLSPGHHEDNGDESPKGYTTVVKLLIIIPKTEQ